MAFTLAPDASASGYSLASFETIGSTSTEAMERLKAGEAGPLWVVAARQSAGRGRRGSVWRTEAGNLFASLGLRLDLPAAAVANLGFVAGVAVVRALEAACGASFEAGLRPAPQDEEVSASSDVPHAEVPRSGLEARTPFQLKWPNDVLADGAKLVGVLVETEETRQGRAVVVGIGVNVAGAPEGLPYRAASLRDLGFDVPAATVFAALSAEWIRAFAEWDRGRGFSAIREAWLARAAGLGGPVAIRAGSTDIAGTFETIDAAGQLLIRLPDGGTRTISAGEVHFGAAASIRPEIAA